MNKFEHIYDEMGHIPAQKDSFEREESRLKKMKRLMEVLIVLMLVLFTFSLFSQSKPGYQYKTETTATTAINPLK
jgi:hypothetical protein